MDKIKLGPQALLVPLPVVLLTAQLGGERPNIITLAWAGICCSEPPMLGVGVRKNRHSYRIIVEAGEFVINIPTEKYVRETDLCGNTSGRNVDKFQTTGFTPVTAEKVSAPLIKECPINMECRVSYTLELGSHDYFIAEIIQTHVNSDCLTPDQKLDVEKLSPIAYFANKRTYRGGFDKIFGNYGYSVKD